jgi:hypothetical protein
MGEHSCLGHTECGEVGINTRYDNFNGFHPVVCIYRNNDIYIYYRLTQI